jgi:PAS domain S-box-containing protein
MACPCNQQVGSCPFAEANREHEEDGHSLMKDVVQASLDPMFGLFEDGTIGEANNPAVQLFGYTYEEFIGRDITSICPTAREIQSVLRFMHAPHTNKQQLTTAIDKSGRELSIQLGLSLNQSFGATKELVYFAHMKDLTEFEAHKSEIEHKDNLCQAMINASFDAMFAIDQRGKILVVNEAACQAFGYTEGEFVGQNISIICNERDSKSHDKYLRHYLRTGEKRVIGRKRPLVARRKDGTEFHIELGVSEVKVSNGESMFCGYVRDRTQERIDKQNLRRKDAVIQDKFFNLDPQDARGSLRKIASARCSRVASVENSHRSTTS